MVNNSATFSFLHLNKSYLYHLSEEAFTEDCLLKDTPLNHSIQSLAFCLQEELGKKTPKPMTKNLPGCHCDLVHSRQSCM